MASIRSALRAAQRPAFRLRPATITRPFTQATGLRLKEDADRSGAEVDKVKHEQIKKQEKGEGHWHEELASQSESHISADREKVDDHDEHMEDLQKETAEKHEKDHPHGKAEH